LVGHCRLEQITPDTPQLNALAKSAIEAAEVSYHGRNGVDSTSTLDPHHKELSCSWKVCAACKAKDVLLQWHFSGFASSAPYHVDFQGEFTSALVLSLSPVFWP
jgi:hypothetical protein